jgi:hypothetical protein
MFDVATSCVVIALEAHCVVEKEQKKKKKIIRSVLRK